MIAVRERFLSTAGNNRKGIICLVGKIEKGCSYLGPFLANSLFKLVVNFILLFFLPVNFSSTGYRNNLSFDI